MHYLITPHYDIHKMASKWLKRQQSRKDMLALTSAWGEPKFQPQLENISRWGKCLLFGGRVTETCTTRLNRASSSSQTSFISNVRRYLQGKSWTCIWTRLKVSGDSKRNYPRTPCKFNPKYSFRYHFYGGFIFAISSMYVSLGNVDIMYLMKRFKQHIPTVITF